MDKTIEYLKNRKVNKPDLTDKFEEAYSEYTKNMDKAYKEYQKKIKETKKWIG